MNFDNKLRCFFGCRRLPPPLFFSGNFSDAMVMYSFFLLFIVDDLYPFFQLFQHFMATNDGFVLCATTTWPQARFFCMNGNVRCSFVFQIRGCCGLQICLDVHVARNLVTVEIQRLIVRWLHSLFRVLTLDGDEIGGSRVDSQFRWKPPSELRECPMYTTPSIQRKRHTINLFGQLLACAM